MAIGVGQRCVVRIQITDIELRNARDIKATIKSPQGEEECLDVSFDEVSGVVYVSVDVNSVGSWAMWLGVRFDKELFYTPAFIFAEVEGDAKPCDAPYIVDVEVQGESVSVTPPKVDVNAVTREEFEQLSKDVAGKVDNVEGKRLSTNDYTDADKALVQDIPSKANKEGYYPDMSVGMADNLVGRGDVQDAHINFRPSAGADNITDGAARIERIKGNSVVWNQLVTNADFRKGTESWTKNNTQLSIVDGKLRIENLTGNSQGVVQNISIPSKHKILLHCHFTRSSSTTSVSSLYLARKNTSGYDIVRSNSISSTNAQNVFLTIDTTDEINTIIVYPFISGEIGSYVDVDFIKLIDLTKMFGAGNEPTTVEEYYQRKPMNIEDEFAYNECELIDMKVNSLVSVSDNAYDSTKGYARVMGGYKYNITANAGATLVVSFYADGEDSNEEREIAPDSEGKYTFPANGICYVNGDSILDSDICVCLNHSYDKPHPAYQQEVKDLGWIWEIQDSEGNLLFPNGMRSAGSAYDEIRFNPTKKVWEAVKRVESRVFAEGDVEDTTVKTDGAITNYPLAEPIEVTLDYPTAETNMDYLVWDFGTEEAIASVPSTPFRADIQYGDNFVDDIRKNKEDIATNKANIAKNTSALNSKQNTLTLTTKPNGNIVIGNLAGQSKEFMPATPSGDPMHYQYLRAYPIDVNTPRGLQYNEATDRWSYLAEYGGITDLTTEEVATIFARSGSGAVDNDNNSGKYYQAQMRTNFMSATQVGAGWGYVIPTSHYLYLQSGIEVAVISPYGINGACTPKSAVGMFFECKKLRRVIGRLSLQYATPTEMFKQCILLEDIKVTGIKTNISFADSPLLSKESLLYMIDNCASNATFTITLHPDVYAKCTDADNGEWYDDVENAIDTVKTSKGTTITLASA